MVRLHARRRHAPQRSMTPVVGKGSNDARRRSHISRLLFRRHLAAHHAGTDQLLRASAIQPVWRHGAGSWRGRWSDGRLHGAGTAPTGSPSMPSAFDTGCGGQPDLGPATLHNTADLFFRRPAGFYRDFRPDLMLSFGLQRRVLRRRFIDLLSFAPGQRCRDEWHLHDRGPMRAE